MIYIPTLTALRYVGDEPQRFKHLVGVRSFPMLNKGDIIVVPSLTAHQLRKKTEYVIVDLNEVYGDIGAGMDENQEGDKDPADDENQEGDKDPADDVKQDETKAPDANGTQEGDKDPADDVKQDETKSSDDIGNPLADSATKNGSNKPPKGK